MWDKLFGKYGGNEIRRFSVAVPTDNPTRADYVVEVQLRRFKILTWPRVRYFKQAISMDFFVSRASTIKEMVHRICESQVFGGISDEFPEDLA